MNLQTCQCREWLLHCWQDFLQLSTWNIREFDFTYAVVVFERRKDVTDIQGPVDILLNDDGEGWPDIQLPPCRGSCCADKLQI